MVWFVEPRQRKTPEGEPLPLWHLVAESDDGGGFVVGCAHDHSTPEEASNCADARSRIGAVTGFPEDPPRRPGQSIL